MASPTQRTWVWVNSGSWWWTGRPGVLWFMGSQRVRHDWATELNWTGTVLCSVVTTGHIWLPNTFDIWLVWVCYQSKTSQTFCVCISHSVVFDSCDIMDCSLPGSSVHGILQARILEWVAIPFSRGSSWPRDWTRVSCIAGRLTLPSEPPLPDFKYLIRKKKNISLITFIMITC